MSVVVLRATSDNMEDEQEQTMHVLFIDRRKRRRLFSERKREGELEMRGGLFAVLCIAQASVRLPVIQRHSAKRRFAKGPGEPPHTTGLWKGPSKKNHPGQRIDPDKLTIYET